MRLRAKLAAFLSALSISFIHQANAQEMLHDGDRVFPAMNFDDGPVKPIRKDSERTASEGRWVYVPVASVPLVAAPHSAGIIRGTLRFDLYKYDPYPEEFELVENTRGMAQFLIDEEIFPAARKIPELSLGANKIESMEIVVDDSLKTALSVPLSTNEPLSNPVIKIDVGLSNTINAAAWVEYDTYKFVSGFATEDEDIEHIYFLSDRYLTNLFALISSEYSHAKGTGRFYDRGVIDSVFPTDAMTRSERYIYLVTTTNSWRLLLAHEACHHILDHRLGDGSERRTQELAADRCSLMIYQEIQRKVLPGLDSDSRYTVMESGARNLALLSMLVWPLESRDQYPFPNERYNSMIAANPMSIFSGLSEAYIKEAEAIPVLLPPDKTLELRSKILSEVFDPEDKVNSDTIRLDMVIDTRNNLLDFCDTWDCFKNLESSDRFLRYPTIRALLYLIGAETDLYQLEGGHKDSMKQTRRLAHRVLAATDDLMPKTRKKLNQIIAQLDQLENTQTNSP